MSALDDELTRILGSGAIPSANIPSGVRMPRAGTMDDELDEILTRGRAPSFGDRAASLGGDILHGIGAVVGAPKRGADALVRASARNLYGLDVPDDATTGQLVRQAAGLDATLNPENSGYGGRLAGKALEFVTDVATDPLTPLTAGAGGAVRGGQLAERVLARSAGEMAPEVAAALKRAVQIGSRVAPVEKVAQGAFGTLMAGGAIEEAADTYTKLREQGPSPEAAESALGALASTYFAGHLGKSMAHRTVDPFAEAQGGVARPETERVAPERPALEAEAPSAPQPPPLDLSAERAYLRPDALAEFNAMQARERRAEVQPLADAIRSMTDYETPAPRLGPKLPGEGQEFTLSPDAAEVARGGEARPAASTEPNTALLMPDAPVEAPQIAAGAPDFAKWAEQKGFELVPENREQAARQYVEEHPDASVDQRAEARAEELSGRPGVGSEPATEPTAEALPLPSAPIEPAATVPVESTTEPLPAEAQIAPEPTIKDSLTVEPNSALLEPVPGAPEPPRAPVLQDSLMAEPATPVERNPAETFDRKAEAQEPTVRAADALQALVPALRDTTKIQETGLNYATPRGAEMRDASEVVGRQAAKRTASAIVDEHFPSLRGEKPERIANAIERDGTDPVYRAALQDMHEQVEQHAAAADTTLKPTFGTTEVERNDYRETVLAQARAFTDGAPEGLSEHQHADGSSWVVHRTAGEPTAALRVDPTGLLTDWAGDGRGTGMVVRRAMRIHENLRVDPEHLSQDSARVINETIARGGSLGRALEDVLGISVDRAEKIRETGRNETRTTASAVAEEGHPVEAPARSSAPEREAADAEPAGRAAGAGPEGTRQLKPELTRPQLDALEVKRAARKTFVGGHSHGNTGSGKVAEPRLGKGARMAPEETDLVAALRDSVKAKGGEPVFATAPVGETGPAPTVSIERVRQAFRGVDWTEREGGFDGRIGGSAVRVNPDASITVEVGERGAFEASARAAGLDPEAAQPAAKTYTLGRDTVVDLARGAGQADINEEAFHVAMRLALSKGEQNAVLRKHGWDGKEATRVDAEERAARAYREGTHDKSVGGAFSRIASFFKRVYRSFFPDAESVFEKVRSGEAFGREAKPVDAAARQAQTPTEAQKKAGNYRLGHTRIGGMAISIENEAGSQRKPGWPPLADHYGYLKGTIGKDKDHVDVFVRPGTPEDYSGPVHVVNQVNKSGAFDEHKAVLGYPDVAAAREAYAANYSPGFKVGPISTFPSVEAFKVWLKDGDTTKPAPVAAETRFATKPEPGQRGIPGVGKDVPEVDIEKIGTDETVKQALARVAKGIADRPVDKAKLAADAGLTSAQLAALQARHGDATARHIEAGRQLREASAADVKAKAEAVKDAPDKLQAEHDFATAVTRAGAITAETTASTEAANALAAHKMMTEQLRPAEVLWGKILRAHPALDPKNREALLKAIDSGDQRAIIAATQRATKPTRMAKFLEAWKAGLVSGPPTLLGNAIGNTVFEGMRTAERGVSGLVDRVVSNIRGTEQERFASEAMAAMSSLRTAFPQSLKLLANGLLHEQIDRAGGKYDTQPGAIGGNLGKVVRAPFRVLQAFDDSAKHVAAQGELFAVAWRMAMREAKKGIKHEGGVQGRATEIINKTGKYVEAKIQRDAGLTLDEAATKALGDRESSLAYTAMDRAAHEATFQDAVGKFTQLALDARAGATFMGLPLGEIVAPFIKTPSRILVQAAKRTPLGFVDAARAWKGVKEGTKTQGEFSEALAKPLMGTMLAMSFYAAARAGDITGSGPNDETKLKLLKSTGWQPYSVKIGDSYYQFKRLEPIATILGLAADLAEAKDEKNAGSIAEKLQGALIQNITEKSWLTGITNLAQAWQDPKRYGPQWVRSLEASLVPNIVRKAAAAVDPKVRDTRSALGPIIGGIPVLSQTLPERTSPTGGAQERPSTGIERFLSPFPRTEAKADAKLERELLSIGYAPSEIGTTLHIPNSNAKIELTQAEADRLRKADADTTERLRRVVESAGWRSMSGEDKKEYVAQAFARARKDARLRLYRLPSVSRRAHEALARARVEATA